ncbi:hypothetical protein C8R45DRAFT_1224355 [Mycena sanguinolenta]|nr:hypothetical protein C8R45DRAFT_1224355 [Mycena sanguinolenta]
MDCALAGPSTHFRWVYRWVYSNRARLSFTTTTVKALRTAEEDVLVISPYTSQRRIGLLLRSASTVKREKAGHFCAFSRTAPLDLWASVPYAARASAACRALAKAGGMRLSALNFSWPSDLPDVNAVRSSTSVKRCPIPILFAVPYVTDLPRRRVIDPSSHLRPLTVGDRAGGAGRKDASRTILRIRAYIVLDDNSLFDASSTAPSPGDTATCFKCRCPGRTRSSYSSGTPCRSPADKKRKRQDEGGEQEDGGGREGKREVGWMGRLRPVHVSASVWCGPSSHCVRRGWACGRCVGVVFQRARLDPSAVRAPARHAVPGLSTSPLLPVVPSCRPTRQAGRVATLSTASLIPGFCIMPCVSYAPRRVSRPASPSLSVPRSYQSRAGGVRAHTALSKLQNRFDLTWIRHRASGRRPSLAILAGGAAAKSCCANVSRAPYRPTVKRTKIRDRRGDIFRCILADDASQQLPHPRARPVSAAWAAFTRVRRGVEIAAAGVYNVREQEEVG